MVEGTFFASEVASQPDCWRQAVTHLGGVHDVLPKPGERVAVVGCGTSWFIAQCYAGLRERAGLGWTDAFSAVDLPSTRAYDRLIAISRSGATSEVLELLRTARSTVPTVAITGAPDTPAAQLADALVSLPFADERSVVQTRFATSVLMLLRAHVGEDPGLLLNEAESALAEPLPPAAFDARQYVFLSTGWSVGLAHEAALKLRETAQVWAEPYPAMEYRHGPISLADERCLVWFLGTPPAGLVAEVRATGAAVVSESRDPLTELLRVQRLALALAQRQGLDPDHPRNLNRAVILSRPDGGELAS